MHWELLPHSSYSSDLAPSDFHLFSPLKEALGGKRFIADDEVKLLCKDGWMSNHNFFFQKGHSEATLAKATLYKSTGRICRK
jgi:histone-lysine N-methyltransferase SETMAR